VTIGGKQKQNVYFVYLFGHQVTKKKYYKNFDEHNINLLQFFFFFLYIYIELKNYKDLKGILGLFNTIEKKIIIAWRSQLTTL
jgi:hypothetical protein